MNGRILRTHVSTLFPTEGEVEVVLLGEAPGPLGADQSGLPFWGDRAGRIVYRALVATHRATVPSAAWETWDGSRFKAMGLKPSLHGVALGNAFPHCPTDDGDHFRAPKDKELFSKENLARLRADLLKASAGRAIRVITLGKRALVLKEKVGEDLPLSWFGLPHPSAQGLLQAAPDKGRGMKLSDLQAAWEKELEGLLLHKDS